MSGAIGTPARPRLHFTADRGWINDPHGVCFVDGCYHLFTQHNPLGVTFSPAVHWAHATSPDLHRWMQQPVALGPQGDEVGCWTGDVAFGADGPLIFYTSVVGEGSELDVGRIAVASGSASLDIWTRSASSVVIGHPPDDVEPVRMFRDPQLRREDGGWRMVVGARLATRGAAVLQYRSDDLATWTFDGVLADHPSLRSSLGQFPSITGGIQLGTMWECPQFFAIDGSWVLLFSSWEDHQLLHVVAAVGDYDGRRFTPRAVQRFGHGDVVYATTTFDDADGTRCAISWLRESVESLSDDPVRAGAISLPYRLALDADRLLTSFHPTLDAACDPWRAADLIAGHPQQLPEPYVRLQLDCGIGSAGRLTLSLSQLGQEPMDITLDGEQRVVEIRGSGGRQAGVVPLLGGRIEGVLDVLVDGDTLEIQFPAAHGVLAARTPFRAGQPLNADLAVSGAAVVSDVRVAGIPA